MLSKLFYKKDDCTKEYKIGEELGRGSFAIVKRATHREDGTNWAVKIIEKSKLEKEDEEALQVEVAILQRVEHPNIVQLRQIFDCSKQFYMVMECMTGGELFDRIVEKEKYSEEEARQTVRKITDAIKYCHSIGVVHRDLKPENLLYADPSPEAEIKIADFGLAKLLNESDMMATACGTPGYVAPEILKGGAYTDKVDMWSVGVITYILLCGFPPFYDENNARLFAQIKSGEFSFPRPYWDGVSETAKDFIRALLKVSPGERLSADDCLQHDWLRVAAPTAPLASAQAQLKKFNAKRRFRAHVRLAHAMRVFSSLGAKAASVEDAMVEAADAGAAAVDTDPAVAGGGGAPE